MKAVSTQLVLDLYREAEGPLPNDALYKAVCQRANIEQATFFARTPVGTKGTPRSTLARRVRFHQQTLKRMGLLESAGERGAWRVTPNGRDRLTRLSEGLALVGFSTRLGLAIWGDADVVCGRIAEPIHAVITSPPFPIQVARAYGHAAADEQGYIDFICRSLAPLIERLVPGGSIALQLGNDVFQPGRPSRSLYRERLLLALCDRFGLEKMDELVWHNPSRPPGPVMWASRERMQLNYSWDPILWLAKDASKSRADNRRVLQPHSARQQALMAAGGERRHGRFADGAYRIRPGAFGQQTAGRIARNLLSFSHTDADQRRTKALARALGLPVHGATMPLPLARFLVRFLAQAGDLVIDPFGGTFTTARACELEQVRWLSIERFGEYLRTGAARMSDATGIWLNPGVDAALACAQPA